MEKKRAIEIMVLLWQIVADKGCRKDKALQILFYDGLITENEYCTIFMANKCPLCAFVELQKGDCAICPGRDLWTKGRLMSECSVLCEKYALSPWALYLYNIDNNKAKVHAQQIADWAKVWLNENGGKV